MLFAALLASQTPATDLLRHGSKIVLSSNDATILTGPANGLTVVSHETSTVAANPVYLGYPHGPKTAEFVPKGRQALTWKGTLSAKEGTVWIASIDAGPDSFAASDDASAPIGSTFGRPDSTITNSVYDRGADWLLTVGGHAHIRVLPKGYELSATGDFTLSLKANYYRDHLGYFLWDKSNPLWGRPVAGWCSWMAYLQDVKEADMVKAAAFFGKNLRGYGYDVIQMDDGYQRVSQFPTGDETPHEPFSNYWTKPNDKFPHGLGWLAHNIAAQGMTPGIWVGYYLPLGLKHSEGYVKGSDGKPHKGPWVNYAMNGLDVAARDEAYIDTIRGLKSQGWDYFKIDTLRHILYDSYRQVPDYWASRGESMEESYRSILEATKKAAGPGTYVLACWGTLPELAGLPDGARIGEDVGPDVASMRRSAKYIAQFQYLNNVVWRNDPDYMCLRVPTAQARTWATMNFIAGGHLMVSDPIEDYDQERLDILRRVGPPLMTRPNTVVSHGPDPELMTLNCEKEGKSWLVAARFGWGSQPPKRVSLYDLGLHAGRYLAFDFWHQRFLGVVSSTVNFDSLQDGECQAICLRPVEDHPQVLGTDRHLAQGAVELSDLHWEDGKLSGNFARTPGHSWIIRLYVPEGWVLDSGQARAESDNVAVITVPPGSGDWRWSASFRRR